MEWFKGKDMELQNAIEMDSAPEVEAAVRKGANINAKGVHGVTPLEYAIGQFKKNAYKQLLHLHADPSLRDDENDNTMTLATKAFKKDPDYLLWALQTGGDPNTRQPDNDPIIIRFINDRNIEAIRMMKQWGADINIRTRDNTPLIINAGIIEYWDVVWCLLELGAKFDYKDEPFTMKEVFSSPKVTPPDSPLWVYKVKCWRFLREHGLELPNLQSSN